MKTLVFILSSNYSGSHYLSLLLGSHSKTLHLGEVKNLIKDGVNCFSCGVTNKCALLADINQFKPEALYTELFKRAGEHTELLIDASKKPKWATQFINNKTPHEIKIIHLVRDPRALVRRWKNKYISLASQLNQRRKVIKAFPNKIFELLFCSQTKVYLYKWLKQNQDINYFTKNNSLETHLVTYHDLSHNPEKTLTPIMDFLGVCYEQSQLKYWQFEHHGTQKPEYKWVKERQVTNYIDLRWKDEMSHKNSSLITGNKDFKIFLERNRLIQTENGLTF